MRLDKARIGGYNTISIAQGIWNTAGQTYCPNAFLKSTSYGIWLASQL